MYADTFNNLLNEGPISKFLEEQRALDSKPVMDYCFTTISLGKLRKMV